MIYRSPSRRIFEICNIIFLILFCASIIIPFVNAIAISLSGYEPASRGEVALIPKEFTFDSYKKIIYSWHFLRCFANTTFLTIVITIAEIINCLAAGYVLANKHMPYRKVLLTFFLIPMYFGGGLIPTYLLINNTLRLNDSWLAIILPHITVTFYIIVFRNYIAQLPPDITESAEIDGASEYTIMFKIIIPLVLPMAAAFAIFTAVSVWNEWFNTMIYIRNTNKWSLQYKLRDILANANFNEDPNSPGAQGRADASELDVYSQSVKMAAMMVTILPIICVYPFLQKYFLHGVIVGAVKG